MFSIQFKQDLEFYNVIFKMSRIYSRFTRHTKNHDHLKLHGKRQSIDINKRMQMLHLSDKDFKSATIKNSNEWHKHSWNKC